jgi:hypothetical protein
LIGTVGAAAHGKKKHRGSAAEDVWSGQEFTGTKKPHDKLNQDHKNYCDI